MPATDGRYWIHIDPPDYSYAQEFGFDWQIRGNEYLGLIQNSGNYERNAAGIIMRPQFLATPTEYILPLPRQFSPKWYQDDRLDQHVITRDLWTFAPGVLTQEFALPRTAKGSNFPKDKWIKVYGGITGGVGGSYSFETLSALGDVCNADLEFLEIIGAAYSTPVGMPLATNDLTPMLQISIPPRPEDHFVFGFGELAVVWSNGLHIARDISGNGTKWAHLQSYSGNWPTMKTLRKGDYGYSEDAFGIPTGEGHHTLQARTLKIVPVGLDHLLFYVNDIAHPGKVRTRTIDVGPLPDTGHFKPGPWWIALPIDGRAFFQVQVMGYEQADSDFPYTIDNVERPAMFDFGPGYKPTVAPKFNAEFLVPSDIPTDLVSTETPDAVSWYSLATGCLGKVQILDEAGVAWVSNGMHQKGSLRLILTPGTPGGLDGDYLAPQFRNFSLAFGILTHQRNPVSATYPQGLMLDDRQWKRFQCEVDLEELTGKRGEIDLGEDAAAAFYAAGYHHYDNYAIHLLQDTNGDNVPDTLRVRLWVRDSNLEELLIYDRTNPEAEIRSFRLNCQGVLSRLHQSPPYLPQIVDPNSTFVDPETGDERRGSIRNTYVFKRFLAMAGFDETNTSQFEIAVDPAARTAEESLPGSPGKLGGESGDYHEFTWAPRYDENLDEYLETLTKEVVGWSFYEDFGVVRYHPNVRLDLILTFSPYYKSGTLYATQAQADADNRPMQIMLWKGEDENIPPIANRVVVTGKGKGKKADDTVHLVETWAPGVELSGITEDWCFKYFGVEVCSQGGAPQVRNPDSWIGETRTKHIVPNWIVGDGDEFWIIRQILALLSRRKFIKKREVPLAPWWIGGVQGGDAANLKLSSVWEFQSEIGHYRVVHIETEILSSHPADPAAEAHHLERVVRTRITGERIPSENPASSTPGDWPGIGKDNDVLDTGDG